MESPLMFEKEVMAYLAVDKKGLKTLMLERGLTRHPKTGQFSRKRVYEIGAEIESEILGTMPKPTGKYRDTPQVAV